jgi:hypothetical protein
MPPGFDFHLALVDDGEPAESLGSGGFISRDQFP